MVSEALSSLEADIAALVLASGPLPMVRLEVGADLGRSVVSGRVLSFRQAQEVRRLAAAHDAAVDIEIVADPAAELEQGWLDVAGQEPVEVWRDPGLMGRDHARQTEYLRGDGPLRQLGRRDEILLIQGPDLAIGWVGGDFLVPADGEFGRTQWARRQRAATGEVLPPDPAVAPGEDGDERLEALLREARAQLGAPYRWGGTTERGFDCSGLVQRVFTRATGVLLPKHTGDQRRVGSRVTARSARAGDLLFGSPRGRRIGHVMLLSSSETVLHACRTQMKVIEEPLETNAQRYLHQGFRRPVAFGP